MSAPVVEDLVQQGRAEQVTRRPDLDVLPGDISELQLYEGAAGGDYVLLFAAQEVASTFLATSSGTRLTRLVEDAYPITREPATAAIGSVEFTAPGGATTGSIPVGTRVATVADDSGSFTIYTTDNALSFTAESGPKSVTVTASTTGVVTNTAAGTITRILDSLFDTFTVMNSDRLVGGNEEETDEELRQRARDYFATQRRGTTAALEVGALSVSIVRKATVYIDGSGLVTVYVSDSEGNSNLEMLQLVETELLNWAAAGAVVQVSGSTPVTQDITLSLVVKLGFSVAAAIDTIQAAVTSDVNRLQSGETLYRSRISSAARAVDTTNILDVSVSLPLANLVPASNEIIRAGIVSVS